MLKRGGVQLVALALGQVLALLSGIPVAEGQQSAADQTGVKKNSPEDLKAFLAGLWLNALLTVGLLLVFTFLRRFFPKTYSYNVLAGTVSLPSRDGLFAWVKASWNLTVESAAETAGLDSALLLEACHLGMAVCGILTVPLVFALSPLHYIFGGDAAGDDLLGSIDMSNVEVGHAWLYYVHAGCVWLVCAVVIGSAKRTQTKFLAWRFAWLRQLPLPRAHTLLIENIPLAYRSNERLREFLCTIFPPSVVKEVEVLKSTGKLAKAVAAWEAAKEGLHEAELKLEKDGLRPQHRLRPCGQKVDSIDHFNEQVPELEAKAKEERARIDSAASAGHTAASQKVGYGHSAFVTFTTRRHTELAKDARYGSNRNEWVTCFPCEPSGIRWTALSESPTSAKLKSIVGLALTIALIILFMPICALISAGAQAAAPYTGGFRPVWESFAPTIGLKIMLAIMPTLLLLIFTTFYRLRSLPEAQHKLQVWYYIFQLIFVVLVTAISGSLWESLKKLSEEPQSVFKTLAESLPTATHFYLSFLVLEWTGLSIQALRASNLAKFLVFRPLYGEEEAREKAEPESQDAGGMGGRYSTFALSMTVCIVFSTLCPLVAPLAFVGFALRRLIYGYLIVFAETKKPDMGGIFWATHFKQIQVATVVYCIVMIGVLAARAPNQYPSIVAVVALVWLLGMCSYLSSSRDWTRLPLEEVVQYETEEAPRDPPVLSDKEVYVQPELLATQQGSRQKGQDAELIKNRSVSSSNRE